MVWNRIYKMFVLKNINKLSIEFLKKIREK